MSRRGTNQIMSKKITKKGKKVQKQSLNDDLQTKEELEIEEEKNLQIKHDVQKGRRQKGSQNRNGGNTLQRVVNDDLESDEDNVEYNIEDLNKNTNRVNHDAICDILNGLKLKNKLNKQNSFDLPLPDVSKLTDFNGSDAHHWKKLATTLDTTAKIYGYRVDRTYDDSIKTLNGLSRTNDTQEQQEEEEEKQKQRQQEQNQLMDPFNQDLMEKTNQRKLKGSTGDSTLEKKIDNLNVIKYDLEFDIDPLFQKTSAQFDGGQSNLLLNSLSVDSNLLVILDSQSCQVSGQIKQKQIQELDIEINLGDEIEQEDQNQEQKQFIIPPSMQGNKNYKPSYSNFEDLGEMDMNFKDSVDFLRSFFTKELIPELNHFQDTMQENFLKSTIRADEKKAKRQLKMQKKEDPFRMNNTIRKQANTVKQNQEFEDQEILEQINNLLADEQDQIDYDNQQDDIQDDEIMNNDNNNIDQIENNLNDYEDNKENIFQNDCIEQEFQQDQINMQQNPDASSYLNQNDTTTIGNGNEIYPEKSVLTLSSLENKLNFIENSTQGKVVDSVNIVQQQTKKVIRKNRILDTVLKIRDDQEKVKERRNLLNTHLEYAIDFDTQVKFTKNEVFEKPSNNQFEDILNTLTDDENLKHQNLIPFDIHYKHINAFGGCSLLNYKNIQSQQEQNQGDDQIDNLEDIYGNGALGEMENIGMGVGDGMEFENNQNLEEGLKTSLLNSIITKNQAKNKTAVPIKELKNQIWYNIATKIPNQEDSEQIQQKKKKVGKKSLNKEKNMDFENVVGNMEHIFGEKSSSISIQTTFLTLLHLANEKLLKFEINEEEDNFQIYKDQQLFMNQSNIEIEQE